MKDTPPSSDLRDLPPIEHLLPHSVHWQFWMACLVLVIALAAALWWLRRRGKAHDPGSMLCSCLNDCLREIANLPATSSVATVAHTVSLQLRRYLNVAFEHLALYQTHQESSVASFHASFVSDDLRERVAACLDATARLKYAPRCGSESPALVTQLRDDASGLLHDIHQQAINAITSEKNR